MLICWSSRKFKESGHEDEDTFFNHLQACLRLPNCDLLVILDCCYAARAFARHPIGKQKLSLLISSVHNLRSPASHLPHSFTHTLCEALKGLLKANLKGFSHSQLYRDAYHLTPISEPPQPSLPKPLLLDQARPNYGNLWLRPHMQTYGSSKTPKTTRCLKVTLDLLGKPDLAVMNELAQLLQYLPHVQRIKFDDLYAPKLETLNFMLSVERASKIKALLNKIHARRQTRMHSASTQFYKDKGLPASSLEVPAYDWSSASHVTEVTEPNPIDAQQPPNRWKRAGTWPPLHDEASTIGHLSSSQQESAKTVTCLPSELMRGTAYNSLRHSFWGY